MTKIGLIRELREVEREMVAVTTAQALDQLRARRTTLVEELTRKGYRP